jgi:hypothetical protein
MQAFLNSNKSLPRYTLETLLILEYAKTHEIPAQEIEEVFNAEKDFLKAKFQLPMTTVNFAQVKRMLNLKRVAIKNLPMEEESELNAYCN